MRDEDQGTLIHLQRHVQGFDRFHVQVVSRFVHHQDVWFFHHQLAEQHAALLTTGEHLSRLFDVVLAEQQTTQNAAHRLLVVAFLLPLAHPVEDGEVVFELVLMVLRVVANLRVFRPLHGAVVRLQFADQGFQHGGFTHAVGTEDGNLLAHFQQQVEVFKQRAFIEAFGKGFHFQRVTEQLLVLLEADERVLTAGGFNLFQLDFVDLTRTRGRLTRLRGVSAEAANEGLQVRNLRFLLGVVRQQTLARLGGGGHVLVIVARIDAQLAVVQIRHVRTDHVQEVTVVRDDDHGAVAIVQRLLQPADGVDVQVVRRFVEQQDVRVREQRLCQQHAQLPAGRHFAHRAVMLFNRNAYAQQQLARARLRRVAVHLAVLRFQIGHFIAVFFAHFGQRVDAIALLLHFPQFPMPHDHGVEHGELFEGELILTQLTDTLVRVERYVAERRLQVTAEDLHKGGFSATVGTNQAVTVAAAKFDGNVFEQRLTAKLHSDVAGN